MKVALIFLGTLCVAYAHPAVDGVEGVPDNGILDKRDGIPDPGYGILPWDGAIDDGSVPDRRDGMRDDGSQTSWNWQEHYENFDPTNYDSVKEMFEAYQPF